MEKFSHALMHAVTDCLMMLPILFLAYLLVSYLSHDHNHKFSGFLSKKKKTSVLYASFLGCIPQCGFSTVIADLYTKSRVTLGTLVAVFVATSDEAIPIMISTPNAILDMLLLIAIKIVLALFWGYSIDFLLGLFSKRRIKKPANSDIKTIENILEDKKTHRHEHTHECGHIHTDECSKSCHHEDGCCVDNIFLDAFKHMFEIAIYIFIATFIINLLTEYFTMEIFESILTNNVYIQILIASVVGIIPNCISSVFLVELYLSGALLFPALLAGLSAGAGVGIFILASKNKKPLQTLGIIFLQIFIGIISGLFISIFF